MLILIISVLLISFGRQLKMIMIDLCVNFAIECDSSFNVTNSLWDFVGVLRALGNKYPRFV